MSDFVHITCCTTSNVFCGSFPSFTLFQTLPNLGNSGSTSSDIYILT